MYVCIKYICTLDLFSTDNSFFPLFSAKILKIYLFRQRRSIEIRYLVDLSKLEVDHTSEQNGGRVVARSWLYCVSRGLPLCINGSFER